MGVLQMSFLNRHVVHASKAKEIRISASSGMRRLEYDLNKRTFRRISEQMTLMIEAASSCAAPQPRKRRSS
jgi:hypothetical protein